MRLNHALGDAQDGRPGVGGTVQMRDGYEHRGVPVDLKTVPSPRPGPQLFSPKSNDGGFYPVVAYPRDALIREETGTTRLYVTVTPDGTPERVEVIKSSGSLSLDRAASNGIRLWHWPEGGRRKFLIPVQFILR